MMCSKACWPVCVITQGTRKQRIIRHHPLCAYSVGKGDLHETPESMRAGVDIAGSTWGGLDLFIHQIFLEHIPRAEHRNVGWAFCSEQGQEGPRPNAIHTKYTVTNMIVLRTGTWEEGNGVRERLRGSCR